MVEMFAYILHIRALLDKPLTLFTAHVLECHNHMMKNICTLHISAQSDRQNGPANTKNYFTYIYQVSHYLTSFQKKKGFLFDTYLINDFVAFENPKVYSHKHLRKEFNVPPDDEQTTRV